MNDNTQDDVARDTDTVNTSTPADPYEGLTREGRNGGRLRAGGKPGNKGGGTKPKALRHAMRKLLKRYGLKVLKETLEDASTTPGAKKDKQWAIDHLAKYGVGVAQANLDDDGNSVSPTLTLVERDEGATGGERNPGEDADERDN